MEVEAKPQEAGGKTGKSEKEYRIERRKRVRKIDVPVEGRSQGLQPKDVSALLTTQNMIWIWLGNIR